ncbi:CU044_5270 family protein [Aeromicrobium sp. CFBP 8757]|uniref:CU044_5270 family protein n=1 Tax=Aeromicrobium sp. CFBP 8757 TaxID=2775288 RepID=UPI001787535D|nr:CU044_5270 family protein [Aeromicrobium sp. CFBP 8757]MBD8607336.1 CU044_5270 family protein [Aeromicrobium sp. CFBP 8757]
MNETPVDPEQELARLRRAAEKAGLHADIDPARHGLAFPSADDLLAGHDGPSEVDVARRRRHRRRRVLAAVVSSVAAVSVFELGVFQPWQPDGAAASTVPILSYEYASAKQIATAPGKDARETLRSLSETAAEQVEPVRRGPVQYTVSDNFFLSATVGGDEEPEVIPTLLQRWLTSDGAQRSVEKVDDPLDDSGRGLSRPGGWDSLPVKGDVTQPAGEIDAAALDRLPTDRAKLRTALLELTGCASRDRPDRPLCLYVHILELHNIYVVPARVDAAFWSLMAETGAYRLLGDVKDRAGRTGLGISLFPESSPSYRVVLIVDPATGRLLGAEDILIKDDVAAKITAPAITSFTAFLTARWVRSAS